MYALFHFSVCFCGCSSIEFGGHDKLADLVDQDFKKPEMMFIDFKTTSLDGQPVAGRPVVGENKNKAEIGHAKLS